MTDLTSDLARLSPQRRLELIARLWDSLEDQDVPVTAAQRAELERQMAGFDQDRENGIPWEQLKSTLRQHRWHRPTLAEIDDATVAAYFVRLGER
jgi:putative addiction module component (TIGR02574 family)